MDELTESRQQLKLAMCSTGGKMLREHIREESEAGFKKFIDMPVEKKTSKASYEAQAQYKKLKELLDWIESEIREV